MERLAGTPTMVWNDYVAFDHDGTPKRLFKHAVTGKTGIDCFDYWSAELQNTNYLHNHACMYSPASGFLRLVCRGSQVPDFSCNIYLMETPHQIRLAEMGCRYPDNYKHYVARASNIEQFTNGRFSPHNLNETP